MAAVVAAALAAWVSLSRFSAGAAGEIDCGSLFDQLGEPSRRDLPPAERSRYPEECDGETLVRLLMTVALTGGGIVAGVASWRLRNLGQLGDVATRPSPVVRPRPFIRWGGVAAVLLNVLLVSTDVDLLFGLVTLVLGAAMVGGAWRMVVVVRDGALYRRGPLRWDREPLMIDALVRNELGWGSIDSDVMGGRSFWTRRLVLADRTGTEMTFDAFVWNPAQLRAALTAGEGRRRVRASRRS